jgi:7-cyano-7-deazaguanine synthase
MNGSAILLSGGMDSIALAYWKRPSFAITIDYGQLAAEGEIRASRTVAEALQIRHLIVQANCSELGSGDLSGKIPHDKAPATEWWPFRNQLLITLAGMKAIDLGITNLMFGSVATDDFHRDGQQGFFDRISSLTSFQEGGMTVEAPAISMTTVELIIHSKTPRSLLAWAHSCHRSEYACGHCRGCYKYDSVIEELECVMA